jgi:hypothetical protein
VFFGTTTPNTCLGQHNFGRDTFPYKSTITRHKSGTEIKMADTDDTRSEGTFTLNLGENHALSTLKMFGLYDHSYQRETNLSLYGQYLCARARLGEAEMEYARAAIALDGWGQAKYGKTTTSDDALSAERAVWRLKAAGWALLNAQGEAERANNAYDEVLLGIPVMTPEIAATGGDGAGGENMSKSITAP